MKKARFFETTTIISSALIFIVLGALSIQVLQEIDNPPQGEDFITIKVTARQFAWQFTYPDGTVSGRLDIKVGQLYRLEIESVDVIHGLGIRELGILRDAIPGYTNVIWLKVDRPGQYNILCREFCGEGHYSMVSTLNVSGCAGGTC